MKDVASFLYQKYDRNIDSFKIVFPNRRAGLFFQKYLSELIDKPLFSPQIITINELVGEISGLKTVDQNALVVELFRVFKELTKTAENLDDFYYWGEMLLADFNDVDKYLIDSGQLFNNVKSLREIDYGFDFLTPEQIQFLSTFWQNILNARNSSDKTQFLNIWEKLIPIYKLYQSNLQSKGWAYEGMMYRKMTEALDGLSVDITNEYAFVGFNALNNCEKKLFRYLQGNATTLFFWDYDEYYKNARRHEASLFIDENLPAFPMPEDFEFTTNNFSQLKEIDVVAVPGFSGQATLAANWLIDNKADISARFDNTALVLCDETLLLPMLNTVPENVSELNITMGFPIKSSPAYALVKGLIDLDRTSRIGKDGDTIFYYRNVLGLLSSPLLKEYLGVWFDDFVTKIRNENKIYLTKSDFEGNDLLLQIFSLPAKVADCKEYLQSIIKVIFKVSSSNDNLLKESLYQLHLALTRLHDSVFSATDNFSDYFSKRLFYQLLLRQLDRITIPFEGEPLSGMQLMGFLETRCLDFDNLILLSFNDDKLPGKSHQHSFIPYSLRKGFGLPVIEQRNAMYSYYFYRLIQRAKKLTLVYDSRSDGMSGGEVSRFVTQLKYEASHLKINEKQGVFNFEPTESAGILIEKTTDIKIDVVAYLGKSRVSPSALNSYLDCKLKFYFKYIEKIKETEDVLEDIDHLVFGRIAHKALEELYTPYVDKELTADILKGISKDERKLNAALAVALESEYFKKGNFQLNGKNLLVYDIIRKYVLRILKHDIKIAPFVLLGLEKEYENTLALDLDGEVLNIRFGGIVDRIDKVGNEIRIVDYKTGISKNDVPSIEKLFVSNKERNKAAFQTLLYSNCVFAKENYLEPIVPAVYGARSVFTEDFDPAFQINKSKLIYQANANEFEQELRKLFSEIVNPEIAFEQVADKNKCSFCEFKSICSR